MPDFSKTEIAFRHLSDKELKHRMKVFALMRHPWLIVAGKPLLALANFLRLPLKPFLGGIYRIFVAGKNLEEAVPAMQSLHSAGIWSIPDYSAEANEDDAARDAVADEIKKSILFAAQHRDMVPFAVFKPSGISSVELLEKKSVGIPLTHAEEQQWNALVMRWEQIFELAAANKIPVMIDAEESWFQQAIDDLIFDFMLKYNKEMPVVINTLQMYRKDRIEILKKTIEFARTHSLYAGVKFVRGAYHEKETKRAIEQNLLPVVFQSKEKTDMAFNLALKISIENIDVMTIFCATHNEESSLYLTQLIHENNIAKNDRRIWFSQLYGMSDHITFGLAAEKYNTAKYLPYAPIRVVMPYLIRRAEENTSMKGQTLREFEMLKKESGRRSKIKKQIQS
ncbi:MAG: hypothetical protein A2W93_02450 [Bacteroidetes bacterium GWF2_43_63]|nr:MAG: hypothetical protein A2W94_08460 [Bacteroidetes bacterium GWE2_42_42]OFY53532.1 MAG: hypothetical protein A2W93_02450 [Bacteroidetes bacterium GWF2_43_63]HBG71140.1 proline dehydrogenase [Bacteroidales bacterium]HCB63717.1 proline dehydrogenase [Bacteroidales bacterium]HCY24466.1 proline dehydrogenase [Bacteroidales bacterium]